MLSVDAKNLLEQATLAYQEQIEMAGPYLAARGITKEAALTHRLGYVAEPLVGHEQYVGRLAIPFLTPTSVVDIRFRALSADDGPKYLSRAGAEDHLYNVGAFQVDSDVIAICDLQGQGLARGLANYASAECRLLCKKPSSEIEKSLGYVAEPEMVHRDNLVLMR